MNPQTKAELKVILKTSFDKHAESGTPYRKNHLTVPLFNQLNARINTYESAEDKIKALQDIIFICKEIIRHSKPKDNAVFNRYEMEDDLFQRAKHSFDLKEGQSTCLPVLSNVGGIIVNESFKIPVFNIESDIVHPNEIVQQSLF